VTIPAATRSGPHHCHCRVSTGWSTDGLDPCRAGRWPAATDLTPGGAAHRRQAVLNAFALWPQAW